MIQKLHVHIVNNSNNSIENGILKLFINDQLVSPATYKVDPNSHVEVIIPYLLRDAGIQQSFVSIEDHPVNFDDKMFFSYEVKKNIPCILVSGAQAKSSAYFASLMKNDSLFTFTEMNEKSIDFSKFSVNDFIIVNGLANITSGLASELKKFEDNGGTIFILPAANSDLTSYNMLFAMLNISPIAAKDTTNLKADRINYAQGLYEGVFEKKQENIDLPQVFEYYPKQGSGMANEDVIIRLLNGKPFLSVAQTKAGKAFICYAPLEDGSSNFARHALFVPTVIRMAIGSSIQTPMYYYCNGNEVISLKNDLENKEGIFHLYNQETKQDFIPESRKQMGIVNLYPQNQLRDAGNFVIKSGDAVVGAASFNYSRKESDLTTFTLDEIKSIVESQAGKGFSYVEPGEKNISSLIMEQSTGTKLWKFFVILTLIFLLTEVLLIRFLK